MAEIEHLGRCLVMNIRDKNILVVGDLHLGFEEALENSGTLIGRKMLKEMIEEFDLIFEAMEKKSKKIEKVIFLGDVKHEFFALSRQESAELTRLIDYLETKMKRDDEGREVIFIKGNHDNYLLNLKAIKKVRVCNYFILGEYCFLHGNRDFAEIWDKKIKCLVMGHLHPAVRIKDKKGGKVEKYKCFLEGRFKGKKIIILPSFNSYSVGSDLREEGVNSPWKFDINKFNVKIVGGGLGVLDFGRLGSLA